MLLRLVNQPEKLSYTRILLFSLFQEVVYFFSLGLGLVSIIWIQSFLKVELSSDKSSMI